MEIINSENVGQVTCKPPSKLGRQALPNINLHASMLPIAAIAGSSTQWPEGPPYTHTPAWVLKADSSLSSFFCTLGGDNCLSFSGATTPFLSSVWLNKQTNKI